MDTNKQEIPQPATAPTEPAAGGEGDAVHEMAELEADVRGALWEAVGNIPRWGENHTITFGNQAFDAYCQRVHSLQAELAALRATNERLEAEVARLTKLHQEADAAWNASEKQWVEMSTALNMPYEEVTAEQMVAEVARLRVQRDAVVLVPTSLLEKLFDQTGDDCAGDSMFRMSLTTFKVVQILVASR